MIRLELNQPVSTVKQDRFFLVEETFLEVSDSSGHISKEVHFNVAFVVHPLSDGQFSISF